MHLTISVSGLWRCLSHRRSAYRNQPRSFFVRVVCAVEIKSIIHTCRCHAQCDSLQGLSSLDCLHFPPTALLWDCPICLQWTHIFCRSCAYFLPVSMVTHQGLCLSCTHRKERRQKMTVVIHAPVPGHLSLIHIIIKMDVSSFIFKVLPTYPGYYLNVLEKAICKVDCKVDF